MIATIKLYTLPELETAFGASSDSYKIALASIYQMDISMIGVLFTKRGQRVHQDCIIEEFSDGYFDDHDGNPNPLYEDDDSPREPAFELLTPPEDE